MGTMYAFGDQLVEIDDNYWKKDETEEGDTAAKPAGTDGEGIRFGAPLLVEWEYIYLGKEKVTYKPKKPLMVAASVRAEETGDVPKSVCLLRKDAGGPGIRAVGDSDQGNDIVLYMPSVTDYKLTIAFSMIQDKFNQKVFDEASALMRDVGAFPAFTAASAYFVVGSVVTKLVGGYLEKAIDGTPFFDETLELPFDRASPDKPIQRRQIVSTEEGKDEILDKYPKIDDQGRAVNTAGDRYEGIHPYITVSMDAKSRVGYEDYVARRATAKELLHFYHISPGSSDQNELLEGAKVLHDAGMWKKAKEAREKFDDPTATAAEKQKALEEYEAYRKNLLGDQITLDPLNDQNEEPEDDPTPS